MADQNNKKNGPIFSEKKFLGEFEIKFKVVL